MMDNLEDIKALIEECIKENKIDFLANLINVLQKNYTEIAKLSTDGKYTQDWSHLKVLDYITYNTN